jgi:hypothetical protein
LKTPIIAAMAAGPLPSGWQGQYQSCLCRDAAYTGGEYQHRAMYE